MSAEIAVSSDLSASSLSVKMLTEMSPYTLRWNRGGIFNWNGREISVLLPSGSQYSRGSIKEKTGTNRYTIKPDLVDAISGIPVPSSGKVDLALACKWQEESDNTITTTNSWKLTTLSLSLLEKSVTKEAYLDALKKRSIEVLSQTDSSIITQRRDYTFPFLDVFIEKTVISDDVVLQIRLPYNRFPDKPSFITTPFYQIFEKISFAITK